jgi:hypothetical protein
MTRFWISKKSKKFLTSTFDIQRWLWACLAKDKKFGIGETPEFLISTTLSHSISLSLSLSLTLSLSLSLFLSLSLSRWSESDFYPKIFGRKERFFNYSPFIDGGNYESNQSVKSRKKVVASDILQHLHRNLEICRWSCRLPIDHQPIPYL